MNSIFIDSKTFLFNLGSKDIYPVIHSSDAIKCLLNNGPTFGSNKSLDFGTPFNGDNCNSLSGDDDKTFFIPSIPGGNSQLTGKKENFALVEFECYQVILHQTI